MSTEEAELAATNRYLAATHAMQTGVATETLMAQMQRVRDTATEPKHLRVGINSGKVEHYALVKLLVGKGLFTMLDYLEALADAMEEEVKRYETSLGVKLR